MLRDKIEFNKNKFTKTDKKIKDWILKDSSRDLFDKSISLTSQKIGVSPSAITRFCHKIKLSGWNELQIIFKKEQTNTKGYQKISNEINDIIFSLSKTEKNLSKESIKLITKKILNSNNVIIYGESFTEILAMRFSRKLNKIGISSQTLNVASDLGIIMSKKNTVHILLSMSGMNPNIKYATNKILNTKYIDQTLFSIGSNNYSNIKNVVNDFINGEFYQTNDINPYELPYVADFVMEYILNKIFSSVYFYNKNDNDKLIKEISKEKIR